VTERTKTRERSRADLFVAETQGWWTKRTLPRGKRKKSVSFGEREKRGTNSRLQNKKTITNCPSSLEKDPRRGTREDSTNVKGYTQKEMLKRKG